MNMRPDHVPVDLFMDTGIPEIAREGGDPFIVTAERLHSGPDIVWMTDACRGVPGWMPTRHDLIQEIFLDPVRFSSKQNAQLADLLGVEWGLNPLEIDPPEHTGFRKVLQNRFGPTSINTLDPMIRNICSELIAKFETKQSCDFVQDFAAYFPSYVFLNLAGLPLNELPQFLVWEKMFIRGTDPKERAFGARAIMHYLETYIEERKSKPGDDLISLVVNATVNDEPMKQGEIMGMCMLLYFAGLDTVLNILGWCMREIAVDQELQTHLRENPAAITGATQEFIRAFGITLTKRTVVEDLEFHGVKMKAGDFIAMPTCLASRDPKRWDDPNRINIDRKGVNLTLATGPHSCLGAHLAKKELKIVFEAFLSRFRNIRLQPDREVKWHTQGNFGIDNLPIMWDPV